MRSTFAETALALPRKLLTHGYRHVGRQVFLRPVPARLGSEASIATLATQAQPETTDSAQPRLARVGTALSQRQQPGSCVGEREEDEGQGEGQGGPPGSSGGSASACREAAQDGCAAHSGDSARDGGASAAPNVGASALSANSTPNAMACSAHHSGQSARTSGASISASASTPSISASSASASASDRLRAWTPLLPARIRGRTPLAAHRIVNYRTRVLDLFLHHWEEEHLFWEEDSEC